MSTCILIVGPPRSGSSIVAGTLNRLGVCCGDELMPADEWNPRGHYSDEEIAQLLHDWLGELGCPESLTPTMSDEIRERFDAICEKKRSRPLWVAKWFQAPYLFHPLKDRGFDVKIIRCVRDRGRSIASLKARIIDSEGYESTIESWVDGAIRAADAVYGLADSMTVDFDESINDPVGLAKRLAPVPGGVARCGNPGAVDRVGAAG